MERIRHPEIVSLELSEVRVNGTAFWDLIRGRGFSAALRGTVDALENRGTITHLMQPGSETVFGFEAIFLTGGPVGDKNLRSELSGLPRALVFGEEPLFGGACGGFELLQARSLAGWVADLGQSQLKLAAPDQRWIFARDWTRLRTPGKTWPGEVAAQRRRLREFIALSLQMALASGIRPPRALVFGLPTRLSDDGTPRGSSYSGMAGDRTLALDAVELAGLHSLPLLVLNDAELAAFAARADPRLAIFRRILVLTLGFGIGAALVCRSP